MVAFFVFLVIGLASVSLSLPSSLPAYLSLLLSFHRFLHRFLLAPSIASSRSLSFSPILSGDLFSPSNLYVSCSSLIPSLPPSLPSSLLPSLCLVLSGLFSPSNLYVSFSSCTCVCAFLSALSRSILSDPPSYLAFFLFVFVGSSDPIPLQLNT